jgi:hypothetical protein
MFISMDILVSFPLGLIMCRHGPFKTLTKKVPNDSLVNKSILISILGHLLTGVVFTVLMLKLVKFDGNYLPPGELVPAGKEAGVDLEYADFETTMTFYWV